MANSPTRQGAGSFDDAFYSGDDGWSSAVHSRLPAPGSDSRSALAGSEPYDQPYRGGSYVDGDASPESGPLSSRGRAAAHERAIPSLAAVLALFVICAAGAGIDEIAGSSRTTTVFNIALVVGSLLAIILVRRRSMFAVVVAPPLVYAVASFIQLYLRSGGLGDRKVLLDAAANWLVYGFPAIAGAVAAVLIVAGLRLITRR